MVETIGEQPKSWKPSVQFSEFPINPHGYRPAARMINDPESSRVENFLRGVFKGALQPTLLSKYDMPLEEAIAVIGASSSSKHIKDRRGRTWGLFVYQLNMFSDLKTLQRETDELITEVAAKMIKYKMEIAGMETGLLIMATAFGPSQRNESPGSF